MAVKKTIVLRCRFKPGSGRWLSRCRCRLILVLALLTMAIPAAATNCSAQQPPAAEAELNEAEIRQWIEALGSPEFAARERAAEQLISLGLKAIPLLQQELTRSPDPEVKLRAEKLIRQLRSGSEAAMIESFLAGEEVDFENWGIIKQIFRDTPKSRDLFIEIRNSYPELIESLDGTSRELVIAMDRVTERLVASRSKLGWQPRVADAVAMLLPASDENVPVSVGYENAMMFIMQLAPVNRIRNDEVLGDPFKGLVSAWIDRSSLANRQDVLFFAMEWDLRPAYRLAIRTLGETTDTETLAHAMQTIARFGQPQDGTLLIQFLNDTRPASERRFNRGKRIQTQVRDVAAAAIAVLNQVPLTEIGLDDSVKHDKFAFVYEDVGFDDDEEEQRKNARRKIYEVIAARDKPAGS
jgi:hypothetical protein